MRDRRLFFLATGIFLFFVLILLGSVQAESKPDFFSVSSGESLHEIAGRLKEQDLIRSRLMFEIYAHLSGAASGVKSGGYFLDAASTTPEIARMLRNGPETREILVVEGATLGEVDKMLAGAGVIVAHSLQALLPVELMGEFPFISGATSLEGFLFPDTYRFLMGTSPREVARIFLRNFERRVADLISLKSPKLYATIIKASLLEKEAIRFKDRALISGVIDARIAARIPLQIDATVGYLRCAGVFLDCPPLRRADYSVNSPFNTYKVLGLPPAPIANPGLEAIRAALHPEGSGFWYYLSDPKTGKIFFSETFDEHNEKRAKYLGL